MALANTQGATGQWNGEWSRQSSLWTPELQKEFLEKLNSNEFFMPFSNYLKIFRGTCINHDCIQRSHYQISNIGTDMQNKADIFLTFNLDRHIDCTKEEFGIICE